MTDFDAGAYRNLWRGKSKLMVVWVLGRVWKKDNSNYEICNIYSNEELANYQSTINNKTDDYWHYEVAEWPIL